MDAYALSRADFDAINEMTRFKSKGAWAADPTKELTTKVKAAFTREANRSASARRAHAGFMVPEGAGKRAGPKRKKGAAPADAGAALGPAAGMEVDEGVVADVVDEVVDEEEEEEEDEEARERKRARLASSGVTFVGTAAGKPKKPKKGKGAC